MTDLLLVHPGSRTLIYQGLGNELSAVATPVWCGMIATLARDAGLAVRILDCEARNISAAEAAKIITDEIKPALTAIVAYGHQPSASTQNMTYAGALAREIKTQDARQRVMLLGGHVTTLPERTLTEEVCDYVATGEGVYTAVQAARALKVHTLPELVHVPGLMYRGQSGAIYTAAPTPPLLLGVPKVAYDLMDPTRYRAHNHHAFTGPRAPYASIYASLGCPHRCSFCCIIAPFKDGKAASSVGPNSYRMKPVAVVMEEIDRLVDNWGVRTIRFDDEMFGVNTRWVRNLCDALKSRSYAAELNLWAYARIDSMKYELLSELRAAGFRWLCYGIESVSDDVRDDVSKGGYDREDIIAVVRDTEAAGIEVLANYMVGLPDDTEETIEATYQLACELNTGFMNVYSVVPYVGSGLYAETAAKSPETLPEQRMGTWAAYSQHSYETCPLPTKTGLTAADVLRLRDSFHTRYFERPEYIASVEKKFGASAADHVRRMNAVKLRRKLLGDSR